MFRLTHHLRELLGPAPVAAPRPARGPVVVWNLTRRCNLACEHCYSVSADIDFPGELTHQDSVRVLEDLRHADVPAVIFSGGEPLLRPDLFDLAHRARALGLHVALSTNGTLIDARLAARIAASFDYVGISLDGQPPRHDRFRRKAGSFAAALRGLRLSRDAGGRTGLRFTLMQANAADLPWLLELTGQEGIPRFYLSHLNYAGRGNVNRARDAWLDTTRRAMDLLLETAWEGVVQGSDREFVTGNNDADAVYFLHWARRRMPEREAHARRALAQWGGNGSGVSVANIDPRGDVHPDSYWREHTVGNVRERPFIQIWNDPSDPVMQGLRRKPRRIQGRCGACRYFDICGGNTRTRAWQLTGNPWEEDPGCYLDDAEIGTAPRRRLALVPYTRQPSGARPA